MPLSYSYSPLILNYTPFNYTGVFTTMYEYDNPLPPPYHRPIYLAMVGLVVGPAPLY